MSHAKQIDFHDVSEENTAWKTRGRVEKGEVKEEQGMKKRLKNLKEYEVEGIRRYEKRCNKIKVEA